MVVEEQVADAERPAARSDYVPATRAMRLAAPAIDLIDDASSIAAFARAFAALPALERAPRGRAFRIRDLLLHDHPEKAA